MSGDQAQPQVIPHRRVLQKTTPHDVQARDQARTPTRAREQVDLNSTPSPEPCRRSLDLTATPVEGSASASRDNMIAFACDRPLATTPVELWNVAPVLCGPSAQEQGVMGGSLWSPLPPTPTVAETGPRDGPGSSGAVLQTRTVA